MWASNYTSRLNSLHISQRRSIRILFNISPSSSSKPSFHENSILNIYQISDFLTAIFMFKYAKNLLPQSFTNFFTRSSDIHSYQFMNFYEWFAEFFSDKYRPEVPSFSYHAQKMFIEMSLAYFLRFPPPLYPLSPCTCSYILTNHNF